ncbi:TFIIH/NER complex subunit [Pichia californica]|uniref:RNA polymerase II transcription factor B subunit 3 n=1 Tax=Pichia californica TaxID=460514 RepID=A0A9P6WJW4_9ASCO|nr:TFIIH/NER complex subunit [[Candida] californica]KAG0688491.1 TFIIH/NER complex subunit [[Candida] californica]
MVELDWNNVPKDLCPVCKTDKYLSPEIQFKINPECYHKICDACVDRIFALGPSPCPYPNCDKILRRNKFKAQVFDDLNVEKECDIRRRVLSVYNKKEGDFQTGEMYDKYLEEIEDIVYKLLNRLDIEETEERLRQYSIENKQSIELNNARKEQEYEKFIKLQKLERLYKSERNRLNSEVIEEDKKLKSLSKIEVIDQLQNAASDKDPEIILESIRNSMMDKAKKYREQLQKLEEKYLRQKEAINKNLNPNDIKNKNKSKIPFTPFNGDRMIDLPFKFDPKNYKDPFNSKIVDDIQYKASGYKLNEFYERSLNDAFYGLECFISDEKMSI